MKNLQQKVVSLSTVRDIVETNTSILYPQVCRLEGFIKHVQATGKRFKHPYNATSYLPKI